MPIIHACLIDIYSVNYLEDNNSSYIPHKESSFITPLVLIVVSIRGTEWRRE